ncbi:helix-turn-helix transcriptional regulator [Lactiplantibacillus plantarum]|nr:XRE family transcriptional regulator [Lactiplantibacillus plantarum]QIA84085.1 helix-turn-helix transcriptional regulator [Lactiplantibacillus plantarum]
MLYFFYTKRVEATIMEINKKDVGLRIKKIRLSHHYTMENFGKLIGAPKSAVNNWEKGRNLPSSERLEKIAILGNTNVDMLLFGSFAEQIYNYLLDLLLLSDDSDIWLSDDLSNYLDFHTNNSKFKDFSMTKQSASGLPEKRDMALKNIAHQVTQKILKVQPDVTLLTPELIKKNLKSVFEDIANTPDITDYGMLQMVHRNLSWIMSEMNSDYRDKPNISETLRHDIYSKISSLQSYVEKKLKS